MSTDPYSVFGGDDDDDDDNNDDDNVNVKNNVQTSGTTIVQNPNEVMIGKKSSKIPKLICGAGTSSLASGTSLTSPSTVEKIGENEDEDECDHHDTFIIPWSEQRTDKMLLYISSSHIRLVQSLQQFGGNRGYIATQTIPPGTLLLMEQPIVSWSDMDNITGGDSNRTNNENETILHILYDHILMNSSLSTIQIQEILHDLEFFHPTKLVVDECVRYQQTEREQAETQQNSMNHFSIDTIEQVHNMIQELHLIFGVDYDRNDSKENNQNYHPTSSDMKLFQKIKDRMIQFTNKDDASPITNYDIYRMILALRYNALQSGLYYYSAMFNHSDLYNCVKFIPSTTNHHHNKSATTVSRKFSEIRTTRTVRKGEPLTISYIPNILSHASRRHYLWQQHRFDIGSTIPHEESIVLNKMEYIHQGFPKMSNMNNYKDTVTYNIETAVSELEGMYHDIEDLLLQQQQRTGKVNDDMDLFQQAQELEQASLELCISAEQELLQNPIHILLIPCRRLHVDICCMMQQHYENRSSLLSFVDRMKLLSRLVCSAYQLRQLQIMLFGSDHFDIARTSLDLVNGIEELLSRSPNHLLLLSQQFKNLANDDNTICRGLMQYQTVSQWSTLEYTMRKEYERIKALYPDNASTYITT